MSPGSPSRWRRPSCPLPRPWARPLSVGPFFAPPAMGSCLQRPCLPAPLPRYCRAHCRPMRYLSPSGGKAPPSRRLSPAPRGLPHPPSPLQLPHQQPCTRPLFPHYGAYCPLSCLCPQRRCKVLSPPLTTRAAASSTRHTAPHPGADKTLLIAHRRCRPARSHAK